MPENWFTLAVAAAIISLLYAAVAWIFGINAEEKKMLIDLARSNLGVVFKRF
jgi:hypothetical protein